MIPPSVEMAYRSKEEENTDVMGRGDKIGGGGAGAGGPGMLDDWVKNASRPIVIPEVPTRFNSNVDEKKVRTALQRYSYA